MAFGNSQHLSSFGGAAEENSIGVPGCQRFCAGMHERLEFSSKASFSGPLVGAIVPFNAVHRSSTEDTQLGKAASKSSLTTSQLRDHVFNWRSDPRTDVSHQVSVDPLIRDDISPKPCYCNGFG